MVPTFADIDFQFDAAALLQPVSDACPAGESLRYEGTYDRIREARTEDDPVLAQGVWKAPLKKAQWDDVAALCIDALATRSKDLQIAAWLTEAWLHLHGFAGLREGLRTIAALCDRYWVGLYPRPEAGDDLEYRLAPFEWINEKLPSIVRQLPLTAPDADDLRAYSWNDWETAIQATGNGGSGATQAEFKQSAMMTPTRLYRLLLEVLDSAAEACKELEDFLFARCAGDAASLRRLANMLDELRGFVDSTLAQRKDVLEDALPAPAAQSELASSTAAPASPEDRTSGTSIRDRSDAYRRLAEAADYLARTEPHSPTPYLVRRAITWGSLKFEDLLPELVQNNSELSEIFRLLQIQKTPAR